MNKDKHEWIKKKWCLYKYYSAMKNNKFLPFATTWMNLEDSMLRETGQTQILYDLTYMWNL